MDKSKSNTNLKLKTGLRNTMTTKARTPDEELESQVFRRSIIIPRSPLPKKSDIKDLNLEPRCLAEQKTSTTKSVEKDICDLEEDSVLLDIKKEITALEDFLFNENNKISKSAIKFILTKWSFLEGKLYKDKLENEKLKATYRNMNPVKTYAQVATGPMWTSPPR